MKSYFLPRAMAYIIDIIIVSLICMLLTFWIPSSTKYKEAVENSQKIQESYQNGEISVKEYLKQNGEATYDASRENVIYNVISVIVTICYFGTYAYYSDGKTIGKKLAKIKITSVDGTNPTHMSLILRSVLLYNVIFIFLNIICCFVVSRSTYFYYNMVISAVESLFFLVTIGMMLFRKDGRGLHDLICKTKVICEE